jgi:hypothetical protein
MASYDLGDIVRVTGTWTDSGGTATDPGTVTFTYTDPSGTATTLTYVTDAEVVKSSTGVYYVDVTANLEGTWFWRWVSTVSGAAADEGQFAVTRTTIRAGMANLINRTRALANAGTAQYAIADQTYWSDEHIQEKLDSNAVWVVEDPLTWIDQNIDGTARYYTGLSRYKDFEEASSGTSQWIVRDSTGTENGTTNYTADYRNGRVTWSADQAGTAYEVTGYSYDVHAAAVDILEEKLAYVDLWYDFRADNQTFSRSQVIKNLEGNINSLLMRTGSNLPGGSQFGFTTTAFVRSDLNG